MASGRNSPKPPPAKLWTVNEPPFEGYKPVDTQGYARSNHETAIVIDNGMRASQKMSGSTNTFRLVSSPRRMVLRCETAIIRVTQHGAIQR
jgi:hypothetical protein